MSLDVQNALVIGGLVGEANSTALFEYALGLADNANPTIGFIATASGDSPAFLQKFYETFRSLPCRPCHLPLFDRTPDVSKFISELYVILVGGGNTVSMLGVWQAWGLPNVLRNAWSKGAVLVGWSAGAMCWFEFGLSDSYANQFTAVPGLGLIPGSCCPHYGKEPARREAFQLAIGNGRIPPGWGLDDSAALHFRGTTPHALLKAAGTVGATFVSADTRSVSPVDLVQTELPSS